MFATTLPFTVTSLLALQLIQTPEAASFPDDSTQMAPVTIMSTDGLRQGALDQLAFGDEFEQRDAAEKLVMLDDGGFPDDRRGDFLRAIAPAAIVTARTHQLPPSVTLAQAILESGWGRSSLARTNHNLFGIKARTGYARFDTWGDGIEHHGALLASKRYARAHRYWTDGPTFIRHIAPIYAEDPLYAPRIRSLIRQYRLDRWDELVVAAVDKAATAPEPLAQR
ncbi:MAG: glucosaminidase domain-containing protein [Myxococcota bacterium]